MNTYRMERVPSTAAKIFVRSALSCALAGVLGAGVALADDHGGDKGRAGGAVKLLTTIPVPGAVPMVSFDISWVDPDTQLYYLGDRSNQAVDVVNTKTNKFVKQIHGGFHGFSGSNDTAGPNGVVTSGKWLFVTDAPSRVVSIDLTNDVIADEVNTGGATDLRADELAYDPEDSLLLVVNNADSPPFATLIKVDTNNGHLTLGTKITFSNATNGAEQPVWDRGTGKFYQSIPQVGANEADGAVARINPHTGAIEKMFAVKYCQPAGLTLGPNQDLLLGCSVVFDTAGSVWGSGGTTSANPTSVIMDARSGNIDRRVAGISGSDEVWFNKGDGRYYLGARGNQPGPVLGVIDAESQRLVQLVPTVNKSPGSAHSVAANPHNNHAFVPLPANNVFPNCLNGCIAVFGVPDGDRDDDHDHH
jgi:hypothetical protein